MQQQISVVTLGVEDLARSGWFYRSGFGWTPVFENEEIAFYQMNGLVFGTFLKPSLEADAGVALPSGPAAAALGHNVAERADVAPLIERLSRCGGRVVRPADEPPHGGLRGYVADPDGHLWEIAWNPAWPIDALGHVTFAS